MAKVLIALGTNVGNRPENLRSALHALESTLQVEAVSRAYETVPMYVTDQPPFLNAAVKATSELGPRALLEKLKDIELSLGRQNRPQFGPREIDLDLIAYGRLSYHFYGPPRALTVPHPRTPERLFVLAPLADIAPDFYLPGLGIISELLLKTSTPADHVVILPDAILSI